jgi:cystathionine beta-lyase
MRWNFDEDLPREGSGCVKYDLRRKVFGTEDLIPMWVADMDFRTPDFIINALKKRIEHEIMGYSFHNDEYFSSISSWVLKQHKWKIENEWICFCPGIVPALNLCSLTFTRPGDSIIIQPPVYSPFFSAVENHGRNLIMNQLIEKEGKWYMDFEALEKSITADTRMIIISNPHNPVGRAWTADELGTLAEICLKNNILIVSDEIHCDLILPGYIHTPVATLSDKIAEITITCIAPSKTFNLAGLSTSSVIISNPVLRKYFKTKIEHLHIGHGNIFGTTASVAAYSNGEKWIAELISYINGNVGFVTDFCGKFLAEIIPSKPEATYMIWLDCRRLGLTGRKLNDFFIRNAKVGMNEGSSFGPGGEGFMRMNIATTRKKVETAMQQIRKAIENINIKNNNSY